MTKYATPAAFRRALTDKLRALSQGSKWTLPQLRRQFAYDRLLERLYMTDDGWIVKGAVGLLARDIGVRGSLDIDVYRAKAAAAAEVDLREAARRDLAEQKGYRAYPLVDHVADKIAATFADPLLRGTARGRWDCERAVWSETPDTSE